MKDVREALEDFMNLHPKYRSFDLYLSGISYAGIYIPTLAANLLENSHPLAENLKVSKF